MIDRKAIKVAEHVDRLVAAGASIENEGVLLVEVLEAGVAKVMVKGTAAGTDVIAGFAVLPHMTPATAMAQEQFTVPASGSLVFSLRNASLIAGANRAMVVGGADLTVDETAFSGTPPTGTVKVDLVGGRLKFAAGDAGKVVKFLYRHNLTVQQARQRYQERSINNKDLVGALEMVSVAKGYVEIATDQFDPAVDWSAAAPSIQLGDNGILTIGGAGPVVPGAKVLALPDNSGTLQGAMLRISALIA